MCIPDLFEDLLGNVMELTDMATDHTVAFNHAPHSALLAIMDAIMELANPPGP